MSTDHRVDADRDDDRAVKPKRWGRRVYADKPARERLNDASAFIARTQPDDVTDPANPSLSDCLRRLHSLPPGTDDPKAGALAELLAHGMTFEETVVWYWWTRAGFSLTDIHFAGARIDSGGDPDERQESVRRIRDVLESAASKHPDVDPDDVSGLDR